MAPSAPGRGPSGPRPSPDGSPGSAEGEAPRAPGSPPPFLPPLHVIATSTEGERHDLEPVAARILAACGSRVALHLRLPEWEDRRLYDVASRLAARAERDGGWCVVNGRGDIARAAGAQAVQLGGTAPPLAALRPHLRGRVRIGVSVHGSRESLEAARDGANHLILGTIFSTPSHPGREGSGPRLIAETAEALRAAFRRPPPLVAIGGIDDSRIGKVLEAGAVGVAVRRAVWASEDPVRAAERLVDEIVERSGGRTGGASGDGRDRGGR